MDTTGRLRLEGTGSFGDDMAYLFDNMLRTHRPVNLPSKGVWHPPVDVLETEDEYIVILEIAGIRAEDVRLSFDAGQLRIQGLRSEIHHDDKPNYHIMEIDFGPFERTIKLPKDVDAENLSAIYKDGFLEIRLAKRRKSPERTINIKVETET